MALCEDEGGRDGSLTACARLDDGTSVPCALFEVDSPATRELLAPGACRAWVVVVPLLSCPVHVSVVQGDDTLAQVAFPPVGSKLASRALTAVRPQVAAALRGYEQSHDGGRCQVRIVEGWPAGEGRVAWRVEVRFPTSDEGAACLAAFGDRAQPLEAEVVCMEDHVVPGLRDVARLERVVSFSCVIPESERSFFVVAAHGDDPSRRGFAGMNAPRAAAMVAEIRWRTGGAAGDGAYAQWFDRHRVTAAELAWQRGECARLGDGQMPLISVVMPVYRTPRAFLAAAVGSVLDQSYPAWELVVVNASGPCADVDDVLSHLHDARVHVVEVDNRSIAENTNAGIAAATGAYVCFLDHDDVLEPDALWHYARTLLSHPEADVLYCDEDHLAGEVVHGPAFKTFPNYGKLYTHNYVTHLLMVSRRVLDLTERSGAEVAGAQDYDLTLKAFEVAREIVHIPRVLYHWREHEGSTSDGSAQKPFAHEAGRRALAAHLARRGIAATVDDGVLPFTYRVRYELPHPHPLVSIVIPTCDHADLLEACVTSILEQSTYGSFEVVLVENNSVEERTFALYEELVVRDERVRMVTWPQSDSAGFNYSSIVNHGVSISSGEYVVLLNNDTEVIEPRWIEEMLGCLMRPEVGVVGAKLLFGDGLVQHVGMVANPDGNLCHVCQNLPADALGPGYAVAMPGDYAMVTGACQMTPRSLFDELGGYDEGLAVGYNDADYCLRVREAGHEVTVAAHAVLYHREFASRGREVQDVRLKARLLQERSRMIARHPQFFAQGDPGLNPNVDPYGAYFGLSLRA